MQSTERNPAIAQTQARTGPEEKKTDVGEDPEAFAHVGLLVNNAAAAAMLRHVCAGGAEATMGCPSRPQLIVDPGKCWKG